MELSIIIPTKDRGGVFEMTLQAAMEAIQGLDAEIIVVNDSKTTVPKVPSSPRVSLLNNPMQGVASARNLGARHAAGTFVLFLDDDIRITELSLRHVLGVHREHKHVALNPDWVYPPELMKELDRTAFGRFLQKHRMTSFHGWYADASWKANAFFASRSVASFHLSMHRDDYVTSGGYDEQFPHAGFEDYDFPRRLAKVGIDFYIDTRIRVYHNEADRLTLENWLESQERRAFTRAVAVRLGYPELALHYPAGKRLALSIFFLCRSLMLGMVKLFASFARMDALSFRVIGALQAVSIYQGYSSGMKQ